MSSSPGPPHYFMQKKTFKPEGPVSFVLAPASEALNPFSRVLTHMHLRWSASMHLVQHPVKGMKANKALLRNPQCCPWRLTKQ